MDFEYKRDNFVRISEGRKSKILSSIKQLGNLSNRSFYQYTDEEINAIFDEIFKQLEQTRALLINANKAPKKNETIIL